MALGPTHSPIQWVPGALSLGVKRPGREADHSPPSSGEVKRMSGAIPPFPQYAFMAWCLVKAQGQLYLLPFHTCNIQSLKLSVQSEVSRCSTVNIYS
jgi:hypothetical protein